MFVDPNHLRSLPQAIAQSLVRWICRITLTLVYRIRVHGLRNYPDAGGMLICSNHQSFLDPVVLGVVCPRPVNYLARKTLFRGGLMKAILALNDAIPIDRESTGIEGVKETMKRLKRGESVVMFPEGTRSPDGELQPLMDGFDLLARRTKAALLPLAFDGCFEAYPRNAWFPRPGNVQVVIGSPIPFSQYKDLSQAETKALLEQRMGECFVEARQRLVKSAIGAA